VPGADPQTWTQVLEKASPSRLFETSFHITGPVLGKILSRSRAQTAAKERPDGMSGAKLQSCAMKISEIIKHLEERRDALDRAIAALRSGRAPAGSKRGSLRYGNSRHMSAAARRRISAAMKKRWAERKNTT